MRTIATAVALIASPIRHASQDEILHDAMIDVDPTFLDCYDVQATRSWSYGSACPTQWIDKVDCIPFARVYPSNSLDLAAIDNAIVALDRAPFDTI